MRRDLGQSSLAPCWLAVLAFMLVFAVVLAAPAPLLAAPPEPLRSSPPSERAPAQPISIASSPELDRAIEARLAAIYAELDHLHDVQVEVEAGVVHLSGQVRSLPAINEAKSIANRVEGVAAVTESIEQDAAVKRRVAPILEQTKTRMADWLTYVPLLLLAAGVIALAWFIAHLLARRAKRRADTSTFARILLGQVFRAGIIAVGVALALELLGATALLGALLGTAGVIGLALGFAFKSSGENYLASILLSLRQPFDPRDYVDIDGQEGAVVCLTSRATVLLTVDGNHVRIPNSKVFAATITNYTRNPQRRFSFQVGVAVDAELRAVQDLAVSTLATIPGVLASPEPTCFVESFGDSSMIISVAGWIDQRKTDWLKARSEAKRLIRIAFDAAKVDVPEPIYRIRTIAYEPRPAAHAKPSAAASTNVTPDDHIEQQIDRERASQPKGDLLREDGPPE